MEVKHGRLQQQSSKAMFEVPEVGLKAGNLSEDKITSPSPV
jgi:hypothetical protein